MESNDKQTIFKRLQACEQIIKETMETTGQPEEAEIRSINNERLAVCIGEFGVHVAEVIDMSQRQKDFTEQFFESKKLDYLKQVDEDTGKKYPSNKAEALVSTDIDYLAELSKLRDLEKSESVLRRKEKSLNAVLDQSRSRLSLVSKGLPS